MPNWCNNIATLDFKDSHLEAEEFYRKINTAKENDDSSPDVFGILRPRPANEDVNWWEWNLNNWGTKWEPSIDLIELQGDEVFLVFDTAWGPPLEWYQYIEEQYEIKVDATYLEWGMCFCGIWDWNKEEHYDYIDKTLPRRLLDDYDILENIEMMEEEE